MKIEVKVMNAFSIDGKGGNPAGVVLNADHLSTTQKQAVAAKAGFPETAFVSSSSVADYKLDFFTPVKQIPHCGHATIATFSYLKQTGEIKGDHSSKETIDGRREIFFKDNMAYMEQRAPVFDVPHTDLPAILDSVGISASDLITGLVPTIVNTGNSFLMVPLNCKDVLAKMSYNKDAVSRISEKYGLIGFYPFAYNDLYDATTRMFGPYYGIDEEAGTGMAAGPLAAYLYHVAKEKKSYLIGQGQYMSPASPSLIYVELETDGKGVNRLFAGGSSYVSGEKVVEMP